MVMLVLLSLCPLNDLLILKIVVFLDKKGVGILILTKGLQLKSPLDKLSYTPMYHFLFHCKQLCHHSAHKYDCTNFMSMHWLSLDKLTGSALLFVTQNNLVTKSHHFSFSIPVDSKLIKQDAITISVHKFKYNM